MIGLGWRYTWQLLLGGMEGQEAQDQHLLRRREYLVRRLLCILSKAEGSDVSLPFRLEPARCVEQVTSAVYTSPELQSLLKPHSTLLVEAMHLALRTPSLERIPQCHVLLLLVETFLQKRTRAAFDLLCSNLESHGSRLLQQCACGQQTQHWDRIAFAVYRLFLHQPYLQLLRRAFDWGPLVTALALYTSEGSARWQGVRALHMLYDVRLTPTACKSLGVSALLDDKGVFPGDGGRRREEFVGSGIWLEGVGEVVAKMRMCVVGSMRANVEEMLVGLEQERPMLLRGVPGAGKSSLVRELCEVVRGAGRLVELQIDDQMDSKTLLGTYLCTDTPGQFKWNPGALTRAVQNGDWLLIENIDRVPLEVLATLNPLFEANQLRLPSRDQVVRPAFGFRVFGTVTTSGRRKRTSPSRTAALVDKNFVSVEIQEPSTAELKEIVNWKFSNLNPLVVEQMLVTFEALQASSRPGIELSSGSRSFTTRDLFNWAARVNSRVSFCARHEVEVKEQACALLTEREKIAVLVEGLECITAALPELQARIHSAEWLALTWGIDESALRVRLTTEKPVISKGSLVEVGRVSTSGVFAPMFDVKAAVEEIFAYPGSTARLLEQVCSSVVLAEPVLLVGETGTGKTSTVQHLAGLLNKRLIVQNMHIQCDTTDLLGGYKPVRLQAVASHLYNDFLDLFSATFPAQSNSPYLETALKCFAGRKWKKLTKVFNKALSAVKGLSSTSADSDGHRTKRMRSLSEALLGRWQSFGKQTERFKRLFEQVKNSFVFDFEEGALVEAVRKGHWILLDEINLAAAETLQRLSSLLEEDGTLFLTERGDVSRLTKHKEFRLFAAMNPSTDFGKKDLPAGLRQKFTEIYVDEIVNRDDLRTVVAKYMSDYSNPPMAAILDCYIKIRQLCTDSLLDGTGQAPHYSLRTLCRALSTANTFVRLGFGLRRGLYESFLMGFGTVLDGPSYDMVHELIKRHFVDHFTQKQLASPPSRPGGKKTGSLYSLCGRFWLKRGSEATEADSAIIRNFVLTPSAERNLNDVARAIAADKYPVLLQGPTSSGKTTLVRYLAAVTGNKCLRINNHEHTDLQEYMGRYVSGPDGRLCFKEGILVEAIRTGKWIILDELNLAPSEVLEALNRLLDDNRELFIPETQETVKPHPGFHLFATQNPAGEYGGRKILSRAFRNRFLELHVDDLPREELETILNKRTLLAPPFCKVLVNVMKDLQVRRQRERLFAGKHGFITPRELLRWAGRNPLTYAEVAQQGYRLLADRVRREEDRETVRAVLEKHCKVSLQESELYDVEPGETVQRSQLVWTKSLRRLYSLVDYCVRHKEPVLLVGETGCGKTTVCELHARCSDQGIRILNCHQNTETGDFIGSLRPVRQRSLVEDKLRKALLDAGGNTTLAQLSTTQLVEAVTGQGELSDEAQALLRQWRCIFEWEDGPLVKAMKDGGYFLLDELSLAEDAVLERLNSVLEPDRCVFLAEKGGDEVEELVASEGFRMLATMNPGGDYGKRELSPALRNRFTEIWIPELTQRDDLVKIVEQHLATTAPAQQWVEAMVDFFSWFNNSPLRPESVPKLSLRDLIAWAEFLVKVEEKLQPEEALVEGGRLVLLDGLGIGTGASRAACERLAEESFARLQKNRKQTFSLDIGGQVCAFGAEQFGMEPYVIRRGRIQATRQDRYSFQAVGIKRNLFRILRALQLEKPILLEGSPGVGKTSLVKAIADSSGHRLVRINLSEQTDFADLIGSDMPAPSSKGEGGQEFVWNDGLFLSALKAGDWVLLDEINLASQSVLEGLNSVLDYRASIYIPEINQSFHCPKSFRIFAAQNPVNQGGGRKGLPKSFLNRFTKVYMDTLSTDDYMTIVRETYPTIPSPVVSVMIGFVEAMSQSVDSGKVGVSGSPWEFNLRDIFRWCDLVIADKEGDPSTYVGLLFIDRLRTEEDRRLVKQLYQEVCQQRCQGSTQLLQVDDVSLYPGVKEMCVLPFEVRLGRHVVTSCDTRSIVIDPPPSALLPTLDNLVTCVEKRWPVLLTGVSGSGKSTCLQTLARLYSRHLVTLPVTPSTDSTDLIGCFEQVDTGKRVSSLLAKFKETLRKVLGGLLKANPSTERIREVEAIELAQAKATGVDSLNHVLSFKLVQSSEEFEKLAALLKSAQVEMQREGEPPRFDWVDGLLVKALEAGDWVVLDGANLCSPTVLDRLNPVLEADGELVINECGLVGGQPRRVQAHPDFRVFLVSNPDFGEVSRAMRNRCVELCLLQPSLDHPVIQKDISTKLREANASFLFPLLMHHHRLFQEEGDKLQVSNALQWSERFMTYIACGFSSTEALRRSYVGVYGRELPMELEKEIVVERNDLGGRYVDPLIESVVGLDARLLREGDDTTGALVVLDRASQEDWEFRLALLAEHKLITQERVRHVKEAKEAACVDIDTPCPFLPLQTLWWPAVQSLCRSEQLQKQSVGLRLMLRLAFLRNAAVPHVDLRFEPQLRSFLTALFDMLASVIPASVQRSNTLDSLEVFQRLLALYKLFVDHHRQEGLDEQEAEWCILLGCCCRLLLPLVKRMDSENALQMKQAVRVVRLLAAVETQTSGQQRIPGLAELSSRIAEEHHSLAGQLKIRPAGTEKVPAISLPNLRLVGSMRKAHVLDAWRKLKEISELQTMRQATVEASITKVEDVALQNAQFLASSAAQRYEIVSLGCSLLHLNDQLDEVEAKSAAIEVIRKLREGKRVELAKQVDDWCRVEGVLEASESKLPWILYPSSRWHIAQIQPAVDASVLSLEQASILFLLKGDLAKFRESATTWLDIAVEVSSKPLMTVVWYKSLLMRLNADSVSSHLCKILLCYFRHLWSRGRQLLLPPVEGVVKQSAYIGILQEAKAIEGNSYAGGYLSGSRIGCELKCSGLGTVESKGSVVTVWNRQARADQIHCLLAHLLCIQLHPQRSGQEFWKSDKDMVLHLIRRLGTQRLQNVELANALEALLDSKGRVPMVDRLRKVDTVIGKVADIVEQDKELKERSSQAKLWVLLGMLQMRASMPGDVDPAAEAEVMGEVLGVQQREMEEEGLLSKRRHEMNPFVFGGFRMPPVLDAYETLLKTSGKENEGRLIYRPDKAGFRSMKAQMEHFVATLASTERLLGAMEEPRKRFLQWEESWQRAAEGVVDALLKDFDAYDDVTYPFCLGVHMVSHGLHLLALDAQDSKVPTELDTVMASFPSTLGCSTGQEWAGVNFQSSAVCAAFGAALEGGKVDKNIALSLLAKMGCVTGETEAECAVWKEMETLLLREVVTAGQEKEKADGQVEFVMQQRSDEEESYQKMFPDYHKYFDVAVAQEEEEGHAASEEEKEAQEVDLHVVDVEPFARLFLGLFQPGRTKTTPAAFLEAFAKCFTSVGAGSSGGEVFALALALQDCSKVAVEGEAECVGSNVYSGACMEEVALLETPLTALLEGVELVLVAWPENAVLLKIRILVVRLLELPLSTPLMRALVGVESLCRLLNDWETGASRDVSLEAYVKPLSGLVKRWRKVEVKSWGRLLEAEEARCQGNARRLWFDLVKVFSLDEARLCPVEEGARLLHSFMRTSPRGEYATRLEMIIALSTRLALFGMPLDHQRMLRNMHAYYLQWANDVDAAISTGRQPIEAKLKEFVKLARWDDRNYFSLKESAEKSHRQLHKLCKAYDEQLLRPAYLVIEQACHIGISAGTEKLVDIESLVATREAASPSETQVCSLPLAKAHQSKIAKRGEALLQGFEEKLKQSAGRGRGPLDLYEAAVARIKSLRLNKSGIAPKQRALADLFKEMRGQGIFRYHGSRTSPMEQLQDMPSLEQCASSNLFGLEAMCGRMDAGVHGVISQLHMLHLAMSSRSADLTKAQAEACQKVCQNLFAMILEQRSTLASLLSQCRGLNVIAEDLGALSEEGDVVEMTEERTAVFQACKQCAESLLLWCAEVEVLQSACEQVPSPAKTSAFLLQRGARVTAKNLGKAEAALKQRCRDLPIVQQLAEKMANEVTPTLLQRRVLGCNDYQLRVKALKKCLEEVLVTVSSMEDSIVLSETVAEVKGVVAAVLTKVNASIQSEARSCQVKASVEGIVTSLQVCVQHMASIEVPGEDSSILVTHKSLTSAAKGIGRRLSRFVGKCIDIKGGQVDAAVSDEAKTAAFLLGRVVNAAQHVAHQLAGFQQSMVALEQLLVRVSRTLVSQGFCRPAEEEEGEAGEDGEVGEAQSGTGMGEGKGEKDVSKEIEDEEQLLGLEGEDAMSEKSGEEQDGDEGVEMSNDFEGETFDLEGEEEESAEENEEEKEELDREMGELDKEDEEVVDEKLWEEGSDDEEDPSQPEEESFEKDSPIRGKQQEEELRGKDDDEKSTSDPLEEAEKEAGAKEEGEEEEVDEEGAAKEDEDVVESHHIDANDSGDEEKAGEKEEELKDEEAMDADEEDDQAEAEEAEEEADVEEEEKTVAEEKAEAEMEEEIDDGKEEDHPVSSEAVEEDKTQEQEDPAAEIDAPEVDDSTEVKNADGGDGLHGSGQGVEDSAEIEEEAPEDRKGVEEAAQGGKEMPGDLNENEAMDMEETDASHSKSSEVNPWRDPGQASEKWHRRLKLLEAQEKEVEEVPQAGEGEDTSGTFEYSKEDKATTQVLGEAGEGEDKVQADQEMEVEEAEKAVEEGGEEQGVKRKEAATLDEEDGAKPSKKAKRAAGADASQDDIDMMAEHEEDDGGSGDIPDLKAAEAEEQGGRKVLSFAKNPEGGEIEKKEEQDAVVAQLDTREGVRGSAMDRFWSQLVLETSEGANRLCEQLRLVLSATSANKMEGDYRTGKRLNLKRIIPYIASQYRKDKIWLRRTKRDKRDYHIVLAIDNSKSMKSCGYLAMKTFATISKALTKLETGKLCVTSFGTEVEVLHALNEPFSDSRAAEAISHFRFEQDQTFIEAAIESTVAMLEEARQSLSYSPVNYRQLALFISDGKFDTSKRKRIAKAVREALRQEQFVLLIIVENDQHESIMETKKVSFVDGNVKVVNYMDDYPFPYYAVVSNMKALPQVVSDALRQWFELVRQ